MPWTDGVDRATGYLVIASNWNDLLGASGSLMFLKAHTHSGAAGDGSASLGPLTYADYTDAVAPAAPSAGRTRIYTVSGKPRFRPAAGADTQIVVGGDTAGGELAGTYPNPTVAATHSGSAHHTQAHAVDSASDHSAGTQGDILYAGAAGAWTRLAAGTSGYFLKTQGAGANPTWAASGGIVGMCTSALTKNNDTVLADITGMAVALAANKTYLLHIVLDVTTASALAKVGFTFSGTTTRTDFGGVRQVSGALALINVTNLTTTIAWDASVERVMVIEGIFAVTNAGTLQVQGAQNTGVAENTVFNIGSVITATLLN